MSESKLGSSAMLVTTNSYIEKIAKYAKATELKFTEYQRVCAANAVRKIYQVTNSSKYDLDKFSVDNVVEVVQQAVFLNLNASAMPNECYFIVRKNYDKANKTWLAPTLEFGVEGAGNDVILKNFGRDVKEIKSYIVYKEDDFTPGYMNGWDMTLPIYTRTFKTNIPEKVVYLIKKNNGEIDVQYADTKDVMKSLLANIKQNMMNAKDVDSTKILRELSKLDLYDILTDEKWLDYKLKKGYQNNTYESPLISPSYTDPSGMYNMIERKLRNHATRKYPKDFNNKEVTTFYEKTFEDTSELEEVEVVTPTERISNAQKDVEENANKETLVENGKPEVVIEDPKVEDERPKFKVVDEDNGVVEEVVEEVVVEESPQEETENSNNEDDDESWYK